ncbi:hypothetical protein NPX13_g4543 [Xylaria arbuscula]|uniref:Uncharacterized protein n=1 Tax=Xylaria arbuscula TaxID=114810 RepID=A0A9W8TNI6_9PEZI|nr:hypothetical protein NPX13_g4543 [Xylaria arbuscula]
MDGSQNTLSDPVQALPSPSDAEYDQCDIPGQSLTVGVAPTPTVSRTVDDDFELLNILMVFSSMPQDGLSDTMKKQLQEARENVLEWQAWEAKNIEDVVARKVNTHELPQDKSVASALKRNAYRAKVAHTYRERSGW